MFSDCNVGLIWVCGCLCGSSWADTATHQGMQIAPPTLPYYIFEFSCVLFFVLCGEIILMRLNFFYLVAPLCVQGTAGPSRHSQTQLFYPYLCFIDTEPVFCTYLCVFLASATVECSQHNAGVLPTHSFGHFGFLCLHSDTLKHFAICCPHSPPGLNLEYSSESQNTNLYKCDACHTFANTNI